MRYHPSALLEVVERMCGQYRLVRRHYQNGGTSFWWITGPDRKRLDKHDGSLLSFIELEAGMSYLEGYICGVERVKPE